jgi:hypothetical protein
VNAAVGAREALLTVLDARGEIRPARLTRHVERRNAVLGDEVETRGRIAGTPHAPPGRRRGRADRAADLTPLGDVRVG